MAKSTGFLEFERKDPTKRPVKERIRDFEEFEQPLNRSDLEQQAARCMDCGVPTCHAFGCPVQNRIPDWNDAVYRGQWKRACHLLHSTNNFPEFTGRICPAPCEPACTLSINQEAVTIRHIELQIVERGWDKGWIRPQIFPGKSGRRVAVVGSGPAGLAAAQQLARQGHEVVVFERSDRIGGLLRYGIPDYKLSKHVIDRRMEQMRQEGVVFETSVNAGVDLSIRYMQRSFDAIVLTTGSGVPRELGVAGRHLEGIHFAMEYLTQQNRRLAGDSIGSGRAISAEDKKVVVIGGGDTGSDCVGTAHRQGAAYITQLELLPKPPDARLTTDPWPTWPNIVRTSSSHEEGCERMWSIKTKAFVGEAHRVKKLQCVELAWSEPDAAGRMRCREIPDSELEIEADLVLLATGFVHVEQGPLISEADIGLNGAGNIEVSSSYSTNVPGVFAAGDCVNGATLVVTAIFKGRQAAEHVHRYLTSL